MMALSLLISYFVATSIYDFAKEINKIIALLVAIIIVIFIMVVVNKTITEFVLKLIKGSK